MNIIYVDTRIVDSTQSWLLILPNKPCVINRGSLKSENRRGEQRSHQIHSVGVGKWKFGSWDPWSPNLNMSKHVPILMETVTGCWWGVEVFIFWQKNWENAKKKTPCCEACVLSWHCLTLRSFPAAASLKVSDIADIAGLHNKKVAVGLRWLHGGWGFGWPFH